MLRDANKEKALAHSAANRHSEALKCYKAAVEITPEVAHQFLEELRQLNIRSFVAPYEADAQLAYLESVGLVSAVLTEDSDLVVYGCKRVLFKMTEEGFCRELERDSLAHARLLPPAQYTHDGFLLGCVLTGCDYVKSLDGVGIRKAFKAVARFGPDVKKAIHALRMEGFTTPPEYENDVARALATFRHQTVYDPATRRLVHRTPLDVEVDEPLALAIG
eukprot:Polyplicarium_translucidae@DN3349_c0_g1_i1.p1